MTIIYHFFIWDRKKKIKYKFKLFITIWYVNNKCEKVFLVKRKYFKKFLWRLVICWRLNQKFVKQKVFLLELDIWKIGKLVFPKTWYKNHQIRIKFVRRLNTNHQIIFHPVFVSCYSICKVNLLFYSEHVFLKANWIAFNTIAIANWHLPVNKIRTETYFLIYRIYAIQKENVYILINYVYMVYIR